MTNETGFGVPLEAVEPIVNAFDEPVVKSFGNLGPTEEGDEEEDKDSGERHPSGRYFASGGLYCSSRSWWSFVLSFKAKYWKLLVSCVLWAWVEC